MMDRSTIAARISRGLGVAGGVLGSVWSVYRPVAIMKPIDTPIATIVAAITVDPMLGAGRPPRYADATRYLIGDASGLQVGDYLIGGGGTYFVAANDGLAATMLIACDATLDLSQSVSDPGYGGGVTQFVARGWPASLRLGGHAARGAADLPGGGVDSGWRILLPMLPGLSVADGMLFVDQRGWRFLVRGAEASELGLRIDASYAGS